jgi:TfoX/Sxy family transcriptional regulator of competence genes
MPYSETLAERVRHALRQRHGVSEKRMFGGLVFFLRGNMLVGAWRQSLVARLGPEQASKALKQPYVGEFGGAKRPMKNWVMIEPDGMDTDRQLADWIGLAIRFVDTLPAK